MALGQGYEVALFRAEFEITAVPASRRIAVTADNRYVLWINGQRLGRGPLRGTLEAYQVEIYDLAPYLQPGRNVLATEVRWMGQNTPTAEVHSGWPGWWVQELDLHLSELDTPGNWKVHVDEAVRPSDAEPFSNVHAFLGRLDHVEAARRPSNWQTLPFDSSTWLEAVACGPSVYSPGWGLAPERQLASRRLPALEEIDRDFVQVLDQRQPSTLPWTLPSKTGGEVWLDVGALTTSYPELSFQGGAGLEVRVTYAEGLGRWTNGANGREWIKAGTRADLQRDDPHGVYDELILPGGDFTFEPFHWRTFWFLKIEISAGSEPVTLAGAHHRFTGFPCDFSSTFSCAEPEIERWSEISLRTLRLCAHETYEDCPYYEQLNYVVDSRLQALCAHYLANDTRLTARCLELFRDSLGPEGLTGGRAPSHPRHLIPPFSLHWIAMVHDYWMWTGKSGCALVHSCLPGIDSVLVYFRGHLTDHGFVGPTDGWAWVD
ncbi:MAG: hypothetical protein J6386_02435 [Candidatus Synoicihabitans palmerolidicus]|nr:hypothetical protein [Candidatus Synoicihabitans palmerolidicus]